MREITLQEMLDAREHRAFRQRELFRLSRSFPIMRRM